MSSKRLAVAIVHTITAGMRRPDHKKENGRQNRKMPVSLLVVECGIVKFLCLHDPMMMHAALTNPMAAVQSQIHKGRSIAGRIITAEQMKKARSAMLSIFDPSSLSAFIFLATVPSIISEKPPQQYRAQNPGLKTGNNSIARAAKPLDADNMLGKTLIYV